MIAVNFAFLFGPRIGGLWREGAGGRWVWVWHFSVQQSHSFLMPATIHLTVYKPSPEEMEPSGLAGAGVPV